MINILNRLLNARWFFWVRASQFVVALSIFTFAALMPPRYVTVVQQPDYVLHFVGNLLLFLSASVATYGRMNLGLLIAFLTSYSILIEVAQRFAPGRHVALHDIFANLAGLAVGLVMVSLIAWFWRRLTKNCVPSEA